MRTIAENVSSKERIVTVVQRLSTWDRPRRICFTSERNMDSKRDDEYNCGQLQRYLVYWWLCGRRYTAGCCRRSSNACQEVQILDTNIGSKGIDWFNF
jgi:hypothetical protein